MFNPNRKFFLRLTPKSLSIVLSLLLGLFVVSTTQAAGFLYDDITAGVAVADNNCGAPVARTFTVPGSFIITDVNFGLAIGHSVRGQLIATLQSPAGTTINLLVGDAGDGNAHYDVLFDDAGGVLDNNSNDDPTDATFFNRSVLPSNALSAFNGQNAMGTWTFTICDGTATTADGSYKRSQLQLFGPSSVGGTAEYIAIDSATGYTRWFMVGASSLAVVMGVVGGLWVWWSRQSVN